MANVLNFSYFFFTISLSFSAIFCPLCSPVWENWGCTGQDCKDSTCQARPGASWAFPGAWAGVPGTAWAPHHQPWPASSAPHHLNNARKVLPFGHFPFHNSLFVLQCQTWYLRILAELFVPLTFQVSHDIPSPPVSPRHLCQFVRAWRLGCWWGWMTPFLFIDRRPPLHSNSASAEPSAEFWRMRTLWGAACDTRYLNKSSTSSQVLTLQGTSYTNHGHMYTGWDTGDTRHVIGTFKVLHKYLHCWIVICICYSCHCHSW